MITDQKYGFSDDLFIDQCSLAIARRIVSLCRRGENRLLFLDQCSLVIERRRGTRCRDGMRQWVEFSVNSAGVDRLRQ